MTLQSGRRHGAVASSATHTAMPMTGTRSNSSRKRRLAITLARMATIRIANTIATRDQSTRMPGGMSFMIGEYLCCCIAAGMPHTNSATTAAT